MNLSDAAGNGAIWKRRAAVEKVSRKKKAAAAMPMQMRICWRKHSLNKHNRICAGTAIAMAVVRVQPFVQPLIIHDLFYFPQQMLLWHQRLQIYDDWLMPCIFSPVLHKDTPVSFIIPETGVLGIVFDRLKKSSETKWFPRTFSACQRTPVLVMRELAF